MKTAKFDADTWGATLTIQIKIKLMRLSLIVYILCLSVAICVGPGIFCVWPKS